MDGAGAPEPLGTARPRKDGINVHKNGVLLHDNTHSVRCKGLILAKGKNFPSLQNPDCQMAPRSAERLGPFQLPRVASDLGKGHF